MCLFPEGFFVRVSFCPSYLNLLRQMLQKSHTKKHTLARLIPVNVSHTEGRSDLLLITLDRSQTQRQKGRLLQGEAAGVKTCVYVVSGEVSHTGRWMFAFTVCWVSLFFYTIPGISKAFNLLCEQQI